MESIIEVTKHDERVVSTNVGESNCHYEKIIDVVLNKALDSNADADGQGKHAS